VFSSVGNGDGLDDLLWRGWSVRSVRVLDPATQFILEQWSR